MRHSQRSGGWWKIGSVALVLFASITALRVPLAPALVHVSPDRIAPGEVTLELDGYGTHFLEGVPGAWIVNDGQRVCATTINDKVDDAHVELRFDIPSGMRAAMSDLVVVSNGDRELMMRDALWTEDRGNGIAEQTCEQRATNNEQRTANLAFPNRTILYETIRNLNFHVPMWFTMITLMGISFYFSLVALQKNSLEADMAAEVAAKTGLLFCALGLITGSIWARFTWGTWWTSDAKLNGAAVGTLIYLAYLVLRGSVPEAHKRMRLAGVYNIFAFSLLIVFLFVVPRLVDSLHPGNGGNPAFSNYDLDNRLRMVFYPAVLGWIGIGVWLFTLGRRLARIQTHLDR